MSHSGTEFIFFYMITGSFRRSIVKSTEVTQILDTLIPSALRGRRVMDSDTLVSSSAQIYHFPSFIS